MLKTACAYIRVSTEQQEELSPDSQKRLLKDFAKKNGMTITCFYEDLGISGLKADKRPEFQRMISDCKSKEHPYDVVLVWKFSRFARNQEESIVYKSLLNKSKIEVVSASEAVPDGMVGGLVERIFEWMDEYYSINLSGEAKRGWEEKRLKGGYPASCPYGYTYVKGGVPALNEESNTVRKAFDMYLYEDRSASFITKWLNQNGHRTRFGRTWDNKYLLDILINPFYAGKIRWKAYDEQKHLRPITEWEIMDGKHEAIITMEEFQAAYKKRIAAGVIKRRGANGCKNWLSGIVKCAHCGGTLVYCKESKHNYSYFRCKKYINGLCSHANYVTERKLTEEILKELKDISSGAINYTFSQLKTVRLSGDSDVLHKQIAEIDKKLKRVKSAYVNGIDTLEEYKASKEKLSKEKDNLLKYAEEQKEPAEQGEIMIPKINNAIEIITNPELDMYRKSEAIRSICEKIVFNKEANKIEFFFYS